MRYDHLRQAGSVNCLGSCFHLSELTVPTPRFMKAWTTKRMFTHDQQVSKKKTVKHHQASKSCFACGHQEEIIRLHELHNNANYTKWEEKKQLLEHWRNVCAPYLFLIAFSGSKPPAWVKRCASRRPNDEFLDTNLIYGLALTRKVISTGDEVAHPPLPFTTKQQLPATTSLTISRFWTRLGSTHAGRWYIPLQFLFGASLPFQNWGITLMFCESNVEPLFAKFEYFIFVVLFW